MIVDEILDGKFHVDDGSLDFSCPRVNLSLQADSACEGSFFVYGPEGRMTEGRVSASDLRMECVTKRFGGSEDEIFYRFDATGMEAGEEVSGLFYIISNRGEYYLPFQVQIGSDKIDSSLGEIRNLFHFTNLARSSFEEAVKLFYSSDFKRVFSGHDRQYYAAYKGLSSTSGNVHNVEEFLLEINKKKLMEYLPEESVIRIVDPVEDMRYALVINRSGWGYTKLKISTEGDFLQTEEETADDVSFLGNVFRLYYHIDTEKLHDGCNFGAILLSRESETTRVPVTVLRHMPDGRHAGRRREKKQLTVQLMTYYQAHRLKKIGKSVWLTETEKLLNRMEQLDGNDIAVKLFRSQMLVSGARDNEAKWQIEKLRGVAEAEREKHPAIWCYYLYLTTLINNSDAYVDEVAEKVRRIYERRRGDWRIAWLLLYLSEEYSQSPSRRWLLLEELFAGHCTSPMLYMEAWSIVCMNPALLRKLGRFEEEILTYAVKNKLMQEDVLLQVVYLAGQIRGYSERLVRILKGCYGQIAHKEVLHEICAQLIKGNCFGEECFEWYRAGVEENLRITRLYESYMLSLPADYEGELPQMILMYFAYRSDLPWEATARLYAYVHRRRETLLEIYAAYLAAMERFVVEQIRRGRINRDLAYLYTQLIELPMIDEESARALVSLLFMREVRTRSAQAKEVLLSYPCRADIRRYPLTDGKAYVPVYENGCKILLGDGKGNCFTQSLTCEVETLMRPGKLTRMISPYVRNHLGYAVYDCYERPNTFMVQDDNADLFALLSRSERIEEAERKRIRRMLVDFYYQKDRMRELDEYLLSLRPGDVEAKDRGEIVRCLVNRGMYEEAYVWVERFGPYEVDAKTLLKLGSRLLGLSRSQEVEEDPLLTGILFYVMKKGKYDDNSLAYLIQWFSGTIKELRDVWLVAESFGVDTYRLSERLLLQMLYTGAHVGEKLEILRSYSLNGGSDKVRAAFVSACCYDFLVNEEITDAYVFACVQQLYREKVPFHPVCQLAFLRFYADRERPAETEKICGEFLETQLARGIVMPFYRSYFGSVSQLAAYLDKTMVEYRTKPGSLVTIHYLLQSGGSAEQEYRHEEMRDMFGGIYVKDFILFFGEKLQYYITEETEAGEQVTLSSVVTAGDAGEEGHAGRFGILNDIMIGETLQDYNTVEDLLFTYFRQGHMTEQIFTLR